MIPQMVVPNPTLHMKQHKSKFGSWLKDYTSVFDVFNSLNIEGHVSQVHHLLIKQLHS